MKNSEVLFIRVPQDLLDRLDILRHQEAKSRPGIKLSRADVVREILWKATQQGKEEK